MKDKIKSAKIGKGARGGVFSYFFIFYHIIANEMLENCRKIQLMKKSTRIEKAPKMTIPKGFPKIAGLGFEPRTFGL
jgi:hypothetical protein